LFASRTRLGPSPVFTAAALLTLALGTGGTTAIFTLIHAVMLRSLPVTDPASRYRIGDGDDCWTADRRSALRRGDLGSAGAHRCRRAARDMRIRRGADSRGSCSVHLAEACAADGMRTRVRRIRSFK
jgi:hypothetical protein